MAAPPGQAGPRLLLFLGGTLAALAGAFTGMGVPTTPEPSVSPESEGAPSRVTAPLLSGSSEVRSSGRTLPPGPAPDARPTALLSGRLLGPSGPVAQAPVALVPLPRPGAPERARLIQLTGLDGTFSFQGQEWTEEDWALHFQVPGFGLQARAVPPPGAWGPGDIQLAYGRWLPGKVCLRDGRPLPGARILVGLPIPTAEGTRVLWTDSGLAGPEGGFVARDLPPGEKVLLLGEHPECSPTLPMEIWTPTSGPASELTLVLCTGVELAGQVVDRKGIGAARTRIGWEAIHAGGLRIRRDAITAEEGRFLLCGLPESAEEWTLELAGPEGRRKSVTLRAGAWPSGVRIQLPW